LDISTELVVNEMMMIIDGVHLVLDT